MPARPVRAAIADPFALRKVSRFSAAVGGVTVFIEAGLGRCSAIPPESAVVEGKHVVARFVEGVEMRAKTAHRPPAGWAEEDPIT